MFPFGSQYHRPPTPFREFWDSDLKIAREQGFNIIRSWVMWNWVETEEGKYNFEQYEHLLSLCEKHGLKIIFLFELEGVPAWIVEKHPDAVYVDKDDKKYYPQTASCVQGGGFPGLCYHHDEVHRLQMQFIRTFTNHFKGSDVVFGYEPMNEPQLDPSRFEVNNPYCYCSHSIAKFQAWLRKKYNNDIRQLCRAWKGSFSAFEQVKPPRRSGTFVDWMDWRLFMLTTFGGLIQERLDVIRKGDPRHIPLAHAASQGCVAHNMACELIDDWLHAKNADIYGASSFPSSQGFEGISMGMDLSRKAAAGRPYWFAETNPAGGGYGYGRMARSGSCAFCGSDHPNIEPVSKANQGDQMFETGADQTALAAWLGFASGMKGMLYWQYRHEMYGMEYREGFMSFTSEVTDNLRRAGEIARLAQANEKLFMDAEYPKPEVAIGFNPEGYFLNQAQIGCSDYYRNSLRGAYNALWSLDYPTDFVRLDEYAVDETYEAYKILYLPFTQWVSARCAEKLKQFVAGGGTLVAESSLAQYAPDWFHSMVIPGAGLDEIFGCQREHIRTAMQHSFNFNGIELPSMFYMERLKPTTGTPIGVFEDGSVAATMNRFGTGKAIYIGSNPFMAYPAQESPALRSVLQQLNAEAGVRLEVSASNPRVVARCLTSGSKRLIYIINTSYSIEPAIIRINVPFKNVTSLYPGIVPKIAATNGSETVLRLVMQPAEAHALVTE